MAKKIGGLFVEVVTPLQENGAVDFGELERHLNFLMLAGVDGVVLADLAGQAPTLSWDEQMQIICRGGQIIAGRCRTVGCTGSNSTAEAEKNSVEAALLGGVDALGIYTGYLVGAASRQLWKNFYDPVARAVRIANNQIEIIPYDLPDRGANGLTPYDLEALVNNHPNVTAVVSTAPLDRLRELRAQLPPGFPVMCRHDRRAVEMMTDPEVGGNGLFSVVANVFPAAIKDMVDAFLAGDWIAGRRIYDNLEPLFRLVVVQGVDSAQRYPSPCAIMTVTGILGMNSGCLRPPLGMMEETAVHQVVSALREVFRRAPEYFAPIVDHYGRRVAERLFDDTVWQSFIAE
ncbi:MAG: dihydrodipicolinate synthase family protein [Candidatus Vogelbacteria bacterium]|nr:dihydrodipicolinate synthase family protein [Candidatus Vogelbacteria bacterium]